MKLASYKDGSRDGQLVVVSRDLATAHCAPGLATRMQHLLDDWDFLSPQLEDLYTALNQGRARHAFAFDPRLCMAPLPRAHQWVRGPDHPALARRLRAAEAAHTTDEADAVMPGPGAEPMLSQGASDAFLGPHGPLRLPSAALDIDIEPGLAVVTGDLAMGCSPEQALDGVRLLMLANGVSLRRLAAAERASGFGLLQSQPATAFAPVAVTPDELGEAWHGGRVRLNLETVRNGKRLGLCEAGSDASFHFGQLLAHLCKTRPARTGSIVGGGTVGNEDTSKGCACIADQRAVEELELGEARSAFLQHGDSVRIDMKGRDGRSVFGALEQTVAVLDAPPA